MDIDKRDIDRVRDLLIYREKPTQVVGRVRIVTGALGKPPQL